MESNLEILNSIMKPYFDKKEEIDNKPALLEKEKNEFKEAVRKKVDERLTKKIKLLQELKKIKARHKVAIEDFKEKMEREIEEYINSTMESNPSLTSVYSSFVRKDLQKNYVENSEIRKGYDQRLKELDDNFKAQEQALMKEIEDLTKISEEELEKDEQYYVNLDNQPDYSRVDLRELVELKDETRKKLFAERKRLNQRLEELKPQYEEYNRTVEDLKEYQIKLNEIVEKLSNFKYEYNAQNQVVNSEDWKKLYEERSLISDKITDLTDVLVEKNSVIHEFNDVKNSIEKVEEYIKLTELTQEEISVVMMSMTPWEKAEYDRRKGKTNPKEDLIEINDNKEYKYEEKDGKIFVDDMENLLGVIFNDVVKTISNLKSIRINGSKGKLKENEGYISAKTNSKGYEEKGIVTVDETIVKLPCGEYLNKNDISEATERLYSKPKAITYIVKETGKAYKMSKDAVQKLKSALKNCTTIELVKENKVSRLDLLKVFGKKKTNDVMKQVEIGELKDSNLEEGEFVNKNETIVAFKNLFTEKKVEWLRNLSSSLRDKVESLTEKAQRKSLEEDIYIIDENYTIKKK